MSLSLCLFQRGRRHTTHFHGNHTQCSTSNVMSIHIAWVVGWVGWPYGWTTSFMMPLVQPILKLSNGWSNVVVCESYNMYMHISWNKELHYQYSYEWHIDAKCLPNCSIIMFYLFIAAVSTKDSSPSSAYQTCPQIFLRLLLLKGRRSLPRNHNRRILVHTFSVHSLAYPIFI